MKIMNFYRLHQIPRKNCLSMVSMQHVQWLLGKFRHSNIADCRSSFNRSIETMDKTCKGVKSLICPVIPLAKCCRHSACEPSVVFPDGVSTLSLPCLCAKLKLRLF